MLTDDELGVRLRTRLDQELAAVTAPSDLTDSLRRRARRATATRASLVAGLALVTVAAGVVALGGGGSPSPEADAGPSTAPPVYDVAYVAGQTDGALAKASDFVLRAEYSVDSTELFSYVDTTDMLTLRSRYDIAGPGGPVRSIAVVPGPDGPHGTWEVLVLDHQHQAWWRYTFEPPTLPDGTVVVHSPPRFYDPAEIRDALASGEATLVGREQIDGRETWHLRTDVYRLGELSATLDIYADPQTYLPVRVVTTAGPERDDVRSVDLTWLPRTGENLALLEVPIPEGYGYHEAPIVPDAGPPVG